MDHRILGQNKLLAGLGDDAVREVARSLTSAEFAPGEALALEGRLADRVYLLFEGTARVLKRDPAGEEVDIGTLGPGDFFGEMTAALGAAERSASVVADTPVRAGCIDGGRFAELLETFPRLARNVLAQVVGFLQTANERYLVRVRAERAEGDRRMAERTAALERMNERVRHELEIAQRVQRNLLPERRREFPGVTVEAEYLPCDELGGDIVGVFRVDETRIAVYGGDVCGHGIYAAVVMSYVKKLVESSVKRILLKGQYVVKPPGAVLTSINQAFISEISQGDPELYLTLFLGVLDLRDLAFSFASAGIHRAPLVLAGGRLQELFDVSDFPIGHVPGNEYQTHRRKLAAGDALLFASDGVVEAERDGEPYGMSRLKAELMREAARPGGAKAADLAAAVSAYLGGARPQDDMCFLLVDVQAALPPLG